MPASTHPRLQMTSPGFPLAARDEYVERHRWTEFGNASQEVWKVSGIGSVGGQTIAGLPYVYRLYTDPELNPCSEVWPFTTGFGDPTQGAVVPLVIHAEVFPSVVDIKNQDGQVRDERQVTQLVRLALDRDVAGSLAVAFQQPAAVRVQEQSDTVLREEGWILFS